MIRRYGTLGCLLTTSTSDVAMRETRRVTGPAVKASMVDDPTTTSDAPLARLLSSHDGVPLTTSTSTSTSERPRHQAPNSSARCCSW